MALYQPAGAENPSAAFLAGQAHGAALATQHAARTPAAAKPPKPAKTGGGGSTLNDLLAQAQQIAAAQTNAQVAAVKAQQNLYTSQAAEKAQQIQQASQAAAQLLAGMGDQTANSYNTAAADLAGLAHGFSGQTQTDATNAASQVQAQLAQLGAPAGSAKTATGQTSDPAAIGNVLYGTGGFIPGSVLLSQGQAAAAAARGLPANFLAYGNQQALGTIGAGQQQADALTQNILNARAQQPSLYQSILSSLNSTLTNQALAQSLVGSRAVSSQVAQQNADTRATQAANTATYQQGRLAQTGKPKPLSATAAKNLNALADELYGGVAPKKVYAVTGYDQSGKAIHDWVKEPGTGSPPALYGAAYARLVAAGASPAVARQLVNSRYAPGEGGRPLTAQQRQANRQAKKQGRKAVTAINPAFRLP